MTPYILLVVVLQSLIAGSTSSDNNECHAPENGKLNSVRGSLETYVVRCNVGYALLGPQVMFCLNGKWDKSPPVCEKIDLEPMCEDLPVPTYGRKNCNGDFPIIGVYCKFKCMKGYALKGSEDRRCKSDLTWSGTLAQCLVECETPPPLYNGTVINCSEKPKAGDTCRFKCNRGYVLEGPHNLFCKPSGKLLDEDGNERYPRCIAVSKPVSSRPQTDFQQQRTHSLSERRNPSYSCGSTNGGCSQRCLIINDVPRCLCFRGYKLWSDGRTCKDIDECANEPHLCDQICENNLGSYKCSCYPGYVMNAYNKCEARGTAFYAVNENRRNNIASNRVYSISQLASRPTGSSRRGEQENNFQVTYRPENQPSPSTDNPCLVENGGCKQMCVLVSGIAKCQCNPGYRLNADGISCADINECSDKKLHNCEYNCHNTRGSYRCSCPTGYNLISDGKCEDIDECAEEGKCHHLCHNTPGSFTCSCLPGYVLTTEGKCEGCRRNSYRSETESHCTECPPNSYTDAEGKTSVDDCQCLPGFLGNPEQNIPCEDIDECADNKNGCSDKCVNTPGGVHCSCPAGFEIKEDGKTCGDIDECSTKNGGCQGICNNTVGGFSCSCLKGYVASTKDRYSCDDIDECEKNNGGCEHICVNYPGGYHCTCKSGYRLSAGKKTCIAIHCPRLPVPHYSDLRCKSQNSTSSQQKIIHHNPNMDGFPVGTTCKIICSRGFKVSPQDKTIECLEDGDWSDVLPECRALQCLALLAPENGDIHPRSCTAGLTSVKQRCTFTCHPGYQLEGKPVATCKNNLTWSLDEFPKCLPVKVMPSISCPYDISVDLKLQEKFVHVTIPKPKTNMENIEISPEWVNIGQTLPFPAGKTDIKFTAISPTADNDTCIMSIIVLDKEPPTFIGCPEFIEVQDAGVYGVPVTWREPEAIDNVGVESITKSIEPNSTLTPGVHIVEYVANDAAGNIGSCSFEINVTRALCSDLKDPENGNANCMDWTLGKLCEPYCEDGYTMDPNAIPIYTCDESGVWSPSDVVSPCLNFAEYYSTVDPLCGLGYDFIMVNETGEVVCMESTKETTG